MFTKFLLLVVSSFVAFGIVTTPSFSQPNKPRKGAWQGTNKVGVILYVEEDNSDLRRGPVLSGWLRNSAGTHRLRNCSFNYEDNTFRAEFMGSGKTNRMEIEYREGDESKGTAIALWEGEAVTFYQKK